MLQSSRMKKVKPFGVGFTLTELMIVVVIIGILSAIAGPMYTKYIRKSRTSEAVSNLGAIAMYEETYFSEADSYVTADPNPATVPTGTRLTFNSAIAGWNLLGRVIPNGSPLYFQYEVVAGQYNSGGTAVATTTSGARLQQPTYTGGSGAGTNCAATTPPRPSANGLSIPVIASSNWFFARAMGNQRSDTNCSMFVKVIDRTDLYSVNETE